MGKKKEKVIDLKPEKISEEELKELHNVISAINKLKFDIGVMESQKFGALQALSQGTDMLTAAQSKLQEKYGTVDINVQDGTINYKEDGSSDS
jgi:hypothetical protein